MPNVLNAVSQMTDPNVPNPEDDRPVIPYGEH